MGWIRDPEHWGGGIELAVLAEHYSTELVTPNHDPNPNIALTLTLTLTLA